MNEHEAVTADFIKPNNWDFRIYTNFVSHVGKKFIERDEMGIHILTFYWWRQRLGPSNSFWDLHSPRPLGSPCPTVGLARLNQLTSSSALCMDKILITVMFFPQLLSNFIYFRSNGSTSTVSVKYIQIYRLRLKATCE